MTKETFKGVCSVLSTLPSNVKWDEGIAAIYMTIMRNWDDRVVGEIMRHVLLKCEFRPTIAELRNIGLRIFADMPTVQQLQQVVTSLCYQYQAEQRIAKADLIHPSINCIIKMAGGWRRVGMMDSESSRSVIKECYAEYITADSNDEFLINPPDSKSHELSAGDAITKAITE